MNNEERHEVINFLLAQDMEWARGQTIWVLLELIEGLLNETYWLESDQFLEALYAERKKGAA